MYLTVHAALGPACNRYEYQTQKGKKMFLESRAEPALEADIRTAIPEPIV
jgi:hypothetical protein